MKALPIDGCQQKKALAPQLEVPASQIPSIELDCGPNDRVGRLLDRPRQLVDELELEQGLRIVPEVISGVAQICEALVAQFVFLRRVPRACIHIADVDSVVLDGFGQPEHVAHLQLSRRIPHALEAGVRHAIL